MIALVADAELPPKIGVHPRPEGSFAHAMPASLRGGDPSGARRPGRHEVGRRVRREQRAWACRPSTPSSCSTTRRPGCRRRSSMAGRSPRCGRPPCLVWPSDASPRPSAGRAPRAALIGAGIQGRSHLAVLGRVLPGVSLTLFDRHPERAAALAAEARGDRRASARSRSRRTPRAAVRDADVVVTAASFGPVRQVMTSDWLADDALVVPVDYATYCAAEVARRAAALPRRRPRPVPGEPRRRRCSTTTQTRRRRSARRSWPGPPARPSGRVVVTHLGVGLADVVFGAAIVRRAEALGLGTLLPR